MKKMVSLILTACLFLALSGCGSSPGAAPASPNASAPAKSSSSASAPAATKSDFPKKPITVIIPYDAGGGSDLCTRKIASIIEKDTGWNLTCTNMPGGSGATGYADLLTRDPDGYTVLGCTSTIVTLKVLGTLDVDHHDFAIISGYNQEICTLGVNSDWAKKNSIENLTDFIEYSKAHPGEVSIASTAVGGIWNVDTVYAGKQTGCEWNIVPNGGGAASAVVNCAGGAVEACTAGALEIYSQAEAGSIKMLGVMADERIPVYPDVETFKEIGYDVIGTTTRSFLAPKDIDAETLAILEEAFMKAVASDEFKEYCNSQGTVAWTVSGKEAFDQYVLEEGIFEDVLA